MSNANSPARLNTINRVLANISYPPICGTRRPRQSTEFFRSIGPSTKTQSPPSHLGPLNLKRAGTPDQEPAYDCKQYGAVRGSRSTGSPGPSRKILATAIALVARRMPRNRYLPRHVIIHLVEIQLFPGASPTSGVLPPPPLLKTGGSPADFLRCNHLCRCRCRYPLFPRVANVH